MKTSSSLLDTNVLLYSFDTTSKHYEACRSLREKGIRDSAGFCLAPQVLFEFYAVVTNPARVVKPRTSNEALQEIEKLAAVFPLIMPPADIHVHVMRLIRQLGFGGRHIYDVVLAATMLANLANNVKRIYTYDADRFGKIPGITVLSP
jgi:predicted nucleic acid-binding protein